MIDIIYTYYNQIVYLTEYFKWVDKFILPEFAEKLNFILIDDGGTMKKITTANVGLATNAFAIAQAVALG